MGRLAVLVVLVEARRGRCDRVMLEEPGRAPRVFRGDEIDFAQHAKGAHRDVLEVPDGRPNYV